MTKDNAVIAALAVRVKTLEAALQAIITAWDEPHYGEVEAQLDHLFDPIESARKIV